jgi:hypothetical protein
VRIAYCVEHQVDDQSLWIDVDEKWFAAYPDKVAVLLPAGDTTPTKYGSKRHKSKVMVLTAVAGTCDLWLDENHPGLIGIWRIAEETTQKTSSKLRRAGTVYMKDCTITSQFYFDTMTRKVQQRDGRSRARTLK